MNEIEALQTACECCEGISQATPAAIENRPGLSALAYRVGTQGRFKASMLAGLSASPALRDLTTRRDDDPTVALLDGWATVLDVLTFYQERIANESYLRTAVERRSLLELARAIGYELSPGVAASTYLAFTADDSPGSPPETVIPVGTRAQSIPGPGEMPQSFETSVEIRARARWNDLRVRTTRPQVLKAPIHTLVFSGSGLGLQVGDRLLVVADDQSEVLRITAVAETIPASPSAAPSTEVKVAIVDPAAPRLDPTYIGPNLIWPVRSMRPLQVVTTWLQVLILGVFLQTGLEELTARNLPAYLEALQISESELQNFLDEFRPCPPLTVSNPPRMLEVYTFRVRASIFGHNAQPWGCLPAEWRDKDIPEAPYLVSWDADSSGDIFKWGSTGEYYLPKKQFQERLFVLDQEYKEILPGSKIVLENPAALALHVATVQAAASASHTDYGLSGSATSILIDKQPESEKPETKIPSPGNQKISMPDVGTPQENPAPPPPGGSIVMDPGRFALHHDVFDFSSGTDYLPSLPSPPAFHFRTTIAWAASELLTLGEVPLEEVVAGSKVELDGFALGLMPGGWVAVSGELEFRPGMRRSEVRLLREVRHNLSDWATHLTFTEPLENAYKRATVRIQANVAPATHGEARVQVLGSGDASIPFQSFRLQNSPLTHVSSPNGSGGESTLEVRVNGVLWQEAPDLYRLGPEDRGYVLRRVDDGTTRVLFGDGVHGARLPSGSENVTATYRSGLGLGGHLDAGRISLLASRPLGVMDVVNPVPAAGAGNPERPDEARSHAPLRVLTLDRIVSLDDFQNFARAFAGVGKARADWLWDGHRRVVHLTVTGADARPLAAKAPLLATLRTAMDGLRDPFQPVVISPARILLFWIHAALKLHPDHLPATVFAAVEETLREAFSYEARDLVEPVVPSRVVALIQGVAGVVAVDLDPLAFEPAESGTTQNGQLLAMPARLGSAPAGGGERPILGAQLLILAPRGIRLETLA